ncbi:MAG: hypothetical protein EON59_16220, partial [Alphaproteobacteria bacterium]
GGHGAGYSHAPSCRHPRESGDPGCRTIRGVTLDPRFRGDDGKRVHGYSPRHDHPPRSPGRICVSRSRRPLPPADRSGPRA